jgi:hypothetical protein
MGWWIWLSCFLGTSFMAQAQDTSGLNRYIVDSLKRAEAKAPETTVVADSTQTYMQFFTQAALDSISKIHSPRRAAFYAAVLPGLGQAYNRQYWKIPIVYAAIGVSAGYFIWNMDQYTEFRNIYRARIANANNPDYTDAYKMYNNANIKYRRDTYRQYVDYSVLVFIAAYALNIVDATVFGHLKSFDVSEDLSFKITPTMMDFRTPGIKVSLQLDKPKKKSSGLVIR